MAVRLSTGCANAFAGGGSSDGSFKDVFTNAVIGVYTGTQPASADAAESGTLLGYITVNGGAFTPGSPTNGLTWDDAVNGSCAKPTATEWSIIPAATGTVGWARIYANDRTLGESTTAVRIDLACGVGIGELRFSTSTLTAGIKSIINTLNVFVPKA